MEKLIKEIQREMSYYLSIKQMDQLEKVLRKTLQEKEFKIINEANYEEKDYCDLFICAKKVEGCSERSIKYYKSTIDNMIKIIGKDINLITTENLRTYLAEYYEKNCCSKVTLDNIRRILSTFFSWLEDENYIIKSPVKRIHKIKTGKVVKETYTDENIEILRDNCKGIRDLAIIDLLNSSGIRVGELVKLNRKDINFNDRECIVLGKGEKQRKVYFDSKTKIHLQKYLELRKDDNEALFVSLLNPHNRLQISGVEIRLRQLGRSLNIDKVHPHKFRRTLATKAIDKGMPIEQVQQLLGHQKIDTTLQYGWKCEELKNVTLKITDGKHGDCENEENSGYYFISAKDINDRKIYTENSRQITKKDFDETNKRTMLKAGDIIVVNTGATIGKTAIATIEDVSKNLTFQKSVAIITVDSDKLLSEFLEQYIIFDRDRIYNNASGSAQKNWLLSQMRSYKIILPPVELQTKFVNFVREVDKLKFEIEKS